MCNDGSPSWIEFSELSNIEASYTLLFYIPVFYDWGFDNLSKDSNVLKVLELEFFEVVFPEITAVQESPL